MCDYKMELHRHTFKKNIYGIILFYDVVNYCSNNLSILLAYFNPILDRQIVITLGCMYFLKRMDCGA